MASDSLSSNLIDLGIIDKFKFLHFGQGYILRRM